MLFRKHRIRNISIYIYIYKAYRNVPIRKKGLVHTELVNLYLGCTRLCKHYSIVKLKERGRERGFLADRKIASQKEV